VSEDEEKLVRINKLLADRGLCSRREGDRLIAAGHILINGGEVAQIGQKVPEDVKLEIKSEADSFLEERYAIALNKPVDYVSNLPQDGQRTASELLLKENFSGELSEEKLNKVLSFQNDYAVAGRLDRASRGLLVFSNDGRVVREITQSTWCRKTYIVSVFQDVEDYHIKKLEKMRRLGKWTLLPMKVEVIGYRKLKFVLQEGKKHQIRAVCRSVGLMVKDLYRIKIGPIEIEELASGRWRLISKEEVDYLLPKKT